MNLLIFHKNEERPNVIKLADDTIRDIDIIKRVIDKMKKQDKTIIKVQLIMDLISVER